MCKKWIQRRQLNEAGTFSGEEKKNAKHTYKKKAKTLLPNQVRQSRHREKSIFRIVETTANQLTL